MRAPFGRTGGKFRSFQRIIDALPKRNKYVEVFGGSGIVLLNKPRVKHEVFNDIESELVSFYKCLQSDTKMKELVERLDATVSSREFWNWCKDSASYGTEMDRAFKWYYRIRSSFGQQGRAFGRSCGENNLDAKKLRNTLEFFPEINARLKGVTIENLGFRRIIKDYDSEDTVFYLDPPYLGTLDCCYKKKFGIEDHTDLIELIKNCKGAVAISGYPSELYDSQTFWDNRIEWREDVNINEGTVGTSQEVLWIKE